MQMKKRKFSGVPIDEIMIYHRKGYSYKSIGAHYGVSRQCIYQKIKRFLGPKMITQKSVITDHA
jgi:predicted DNA-binding protein YlxM (UPF0122 family)